MPAQARSAVPHAEAWPAPIATTPRPPAAVGQPAHAGFHWRIWGAEFAGTGLLILGGLSVVCFVFGRGSPVTSILPSHSARLLVTGLLFSACNSLLAVSPLGRLSGAHLNPAVTLAFRVLGRVSAHDVGGYIVAQVLGALAGAAALRLLWRGVAESVDGGATAAAVPLPAAFGLEAAMTALLMVVILFCVSSARFARWTPLAIWPLIALLVWGGASYTGTSLNPARSAGPALIFGESLESLWLYLAAPTLGAVAVGLAWRRRHAGAQPKTAKLFHDARYACSLASELPTRTPSAGTARTAARRV
jgi:aquaporin Z